MNNVAIGLRLTRVADNEDLGASKFFGTPTVPREWVKEGFRKDEIFIGQIRLADIAEYDHNNQLPHHGYLYFFVDGESGAARLPGPDLTAVVRYWAGEPDVAVDTFNARSPIPSGLNEDWLITFEEVPEDAPGLKLLGVPESWEYAEQPPMLLLQYDPLEAPVPFLSEMAGLGYFFFGRDNSEMADVTFVPVYF